MPRRNRRKFSGIAARAQDFYDAAELLRRFYRDLTGEVLPDAEVVAHGLSPDELSYRLEQREKLLGHGPTLGYDHEDVKHILHARGLYPHGIHVIVEGDSEEKLTTGLVEELLGPWALDDLVVTNLGGVGGVQRLNDLAAAVTDYALRTVLVLDDEGDVKRIVNRLISEKVLDPDDVLVQGTSFEESNFTDDELVQLAARLAATPAPKRPAAKLTLSGADLRKRHDDRVSRAGKQKPGLADTLQKLAREPKHGAVQFSKPELAASILEQLLTEMESASDREQLEAAAAHRPVLKHLLDRVVEPLSHTPPDRPRKRR